MSVESMSPVARWSGIGVVWLAALVAAVAVGVLARPEHYFGWLALAMGACVVAAICIQLASGHTVGVVARLTASVVGAFIVLAGATGVVALVALAR